MEQPAAAATHEVGRAPLSHELTRFAERELERALLAQWRPAMGMYVQPSSDEEAAVQRAVRVICAEAHRLDLRAEELIIALKRAWTQLAFVRARQLGDRDSDVLREIVSSSIEQFFEEREDPTPPRD